VRLVKLPAGNLEPGMFIAELDRPWLETPFAIQGFVVRDSEEILYVSNYVDHVYVDAEYKGARQSMQHAAAVMDSAPRGLLALREEFKRTKDSFGSACEALSDIFHALRHEIKIDMRDVQAAIDPLIEGVFRNQEAVAALLRQKESGEYRYHHGVSMAVWAVIVGRHIGLRKLELQTLAVGCAMCDVGMTQLPSELLDQAMSLTDTQRRIIKAHPKMGAELVSKLTHINTETLGIIENHHERVDGSGYPCGIKGDNIPLLARIAGLVDTYDAMITARPYAKARSSHEATQELLDCSGRQFEPALIEQFVKAIGLFPTGTLVELNSGEVALVIAQNSTRRLKPELMIVLDKSKARLETPRIVDLAKQSIAAEGERWVTRELPADSHGIRCEEFFI